MISPLEFITVAEKTGLIVPIGEWVVAKVCEYLREWQQLAYLREIGCSLGQGYLVSEPLSFKDASDRARQGQAEGKAQ
ncbi:hypothetical protein [Marinobacter litoralis]|uniref:hypothetical protein n=1 Tax=Marinobacter litoralis TaxID=187981 RepID=UPI002234A514|nr:hypothetical protein [Marinobacter litoralis]